MRKRSEAPVQQSLTPVDEGTSSAPRGAEGAKLPIEGDLSAMCVALKERGYGKVRLTTVTDWLPQVRHVVAMWIDGQLQESDLPEAIKGLKGEYVEGAPPAHAKLHEPKGPGTTNVEVKGYATEGEAEKAARTFSKSRASVDIQTLGKSLPPVVGHPSVVNNSVELIAGELLASPDTVTVTWGSEKFYPTSKSYNNFEVGMLSTTVHLKPGQDKSSAARAAYDELEKLGEEFRERKRVSFLRGLKGILGDAKEEK